VVLHDPDAPSGTFYHWTMWNISPQIGHIDQDSVPSNAIEGITSFGSHGYGGPCPPSGTHHYIFTLYALDLMLDLPSATKVSELIQVASSHIIDQAELVGLFERRR